MGMGEILAHALYKGEQAALIAMTGLTGPVDNAINAA